MVTETSAPNPPVQPIEGVDLNNALYLTLTPAQAVDESSAP